MKRILVLLCAVLCAPLLVLLASAPANAASPHFKHNGEPVCSVVFSSDASASVVCSGALAGLGNGDLLLVTTVSGSAVYECQNHGGNIAPGQNKVLVGPVSAPTTIPGDEIKNGNVRFTTEPAVLTAPSTVTAAEAGCPSPNWTGVNPDLTVTSITLTISQGGVLLFTCTASDPDGLSGSVALTC